MKQEDLAKYSYVALLAILAYFSYLVVKPFLTYLLFSIVIVIIAMPAHKWIMKKTGRPHLSSSLLVIAIILVLVLPSIYIGTVLVQQAPGAYETFANSIDVGPIESVLQQIDPDLSAQQWIQESVTKFRQYIVRSAPQFLSSASQVIIGLFVMFFTMFYLFTQGRDILERARKVIPLSKKHQDQLYVEVEHVVKGVIVGQVILGVLQGILGGILFAALGIPNALFWGFIMAILSVIPVLGSFIIWAPAGVLLLLTGSPIKGIVMLGVGVLVISQADNLLRPYVVGRYAEIHPALVLIGVIGGLAAFGVVGFIIGPLVLALFATSLRLYKQST